MFHIFNFILYFYVIFEIHFHIMNHKWFIYFHTWFLPMIHFFFFFTWLIYFHVSFVHTVDLFFNWFLHNSFIYMWEFCTWLIYFHVIFPYVTFWFHVDFYPHTTVWFSRVKIKTIRLFSTHDFYTVSSEVFNYSTKRSLNFQYFFTHLSSRDFFAHYLFNCVNFLFMYFHLICISLSSHVQCFD